MKLFTIVSAGLAHNSYFLLDGNEAAVIDPRRDCRIYTRIAKRECTEIKYIFETHRHEDFLVGSLDLQRLTNAEICHSKALDFKYGERRLEDGEMLDIGGLQIQALHTPGHTDESLCYTVANLERSAEPLMVFSGDTLFVGSVGRTDLQGKAQQPLQAQKLYDSLHSKLTPLNDGVVLYPAHGSGSVCGSEISEQPFSTLGYEKKTNPYLKLDREAFVQKCVATELLVPPYFAKMHQINIVGAPQLLGLAAPKPLSVKDFEREMAEVDSVIVDTRLPNAFAGSHIPGSLSIWLKGTTVFPGWLLNYEQRILLVVERQEDVLAAARYFWRLGFDNLYGFLCEGISEWQESGKPISHVHTMSAQELKASREKYVVLDVREPSEWHQEGIIGGAETIYVGDLPQKADSLERNKRYAVICSVGNRTSIAVSILKQKGFLKVSNVLGGMTAWKNLGYPTTTKREQPLPVVL